MEEWRARGKRVCALMTWRGRPGSDGVARCGTRRLAEGSLEALSVDRSANTGEAREEVPRLLRAREATSHQLLRNLGEDHIRPVDHR